jgi:hypothetical protein
MCRLFCSSDRGPLVVGFGMGSPNVDSSLAKSVVDRTAVCGVLNESARRQVRSDQQKVKNEPKNEKEHRRKNEGNKIGEVFRREGQ